MARHLTIFAIIFCSSLVGLTLQALPSPHAVPWGTKGVTTENIKDEFSKEAWEFAVESFWIFDIEDPLSRTMFVRLVQKLRKKSDKEGRPILMNYHNLWDSRPHEKDQAWSKYKEEFNKEYGSEAEDTNRFFLYDVQKAAHPFFRDLEDCEDKCDWTIDELEKGDQDWLNPKYFRKLRE